MRILVWGAGAIGGTIGAWLKRAGHDITFVDVAADHVAAINADGLKITGPIDNFTAQAPAFTPDQIGGVLAIHLPRGEGASHAVSLPGADAASGAGWLCAVAAERAVRTDHPGSCRTRPHHGRLRQFQRGLDGPGRNHVRRSRRGGVGRGEWRDDGAAAGVACADARIRAECDHDRRDLGISVGQAGLWRDAVCPGAGADLGIADCLARPELLPVWRELGREIRASGVGRRGGIRRGSTASTRAPSCRMRRILQYKPAWMRWSSV